MSFQRMDYYWYFSDLLITFSAWARSCISFISRMTGANILFGPLPITAVLFTRSETWKSHHCHVLLLLRKTYPLKSIHDNIDVVTVMNVLLRRHMYMPTRCGGQSTKGFRATYSFYSYSCLTPHPWFREGVGRGRFSSAWIFFIEKAWYHTGKRGVYYKGSFDDFADDIAFSYFGAI